MPGPADLDFDQTSPLAAKSNIPATTAVSLPLGLLSKTMTYLLFSYAIETSEPRNLTCSVDSMMQLPAPWWFEPYRGDARAEGTRADGTGRWV